MNIEYYSTHLKTFQFSSLEKTCIFGIGSLNFIRIRTMWIIYYAYYITLHIGTFWLHQFLNECQKLLFVCKSNPYKKLEITRQQTVFLQFQAKLTLKLYYTYIANTHLTFHKIVELNSSCWKQGYLISNSSVYSIWVCLCCCCC